MPEVNEHQPGTFCWVELMTTDADAAKKFYGELFGWDHHDDPIGDGMVYTMLQRSGRNVGALYQRNEQQAEMGVPPCWSSYVTVDDADATIGRVKELGGKVILEPMDVFDIGRMAVFQDPTGAQLCLWQPKKHIGAQLEGEPGSPCWNEMMTNDTEKAGAFLDGVFGWRRETSDVTGMTYTMFVAGEKPAGGMLKIQAEWGEVPPHWLAYFAVEDCDATVEQAKSLGAALAAGPYDIEKVGRFAILRDPQGASFAVIKLTPKD